MKKISLFRKNAEAEIEGDKVIISCMRRKEGKSIVGPAQDAYRKSAKKALISVPKIRAKATSSLTLIFMRFVSSLA